MTEALLKIYDWVERHKKIFYASLCILICIMGIMAANVDYEEDISRFFGKDKDDSSILESMKLSDKIVIAIQADNPDAMIEAGERFADSISGIEGLSPEIERGFDEESVFRNIDFIYRHLPVFLNDKDFTRLESILNSRDSIDAALENCYDQLSSFSGMVLKDFITKDPLGTGNGMLGRLNSLNTEDGFEIYDSHIFTKDMGMMLMFASSEYGVGQTGDNARLLKILEEKAGAVGTQISFLGAPVVAVRNAEKIKADTGITATIAMLVIIIVIFFSFSSRKSIPLIVLPPAFGALFALAVIYLVKGSISAIAIGAGTVVMGIAMSYSIHVIAHSNHRTDPRCIIRELAYPLTIGSLTTIGAFFALLFTKSALLQDMGLFAFLSLIGTTLCCLTILPHFMNTSHSDSRPWLRFIQRMNSYSFERNRTLLILIAALTVACLFFYNDVEFDNDMSHINYIPPEIAQLEEKIARTEDSGKEDIFLIAGGKTLEEACKAYSSLAMVSDSLTQSGIPLELSGPGDFVVPLDEQARRIRKWNSLWESENFMSTFNELAKRRGFSEHAFDSFKELISAHYEPVAYTVSELEEAPLISEFVSVTAEGVSIVSMLHTDQANKEKVYDVLDDIPGASIIDRAFFSKKMIDMIRSDFDFILWVSSIIVFIALLCSYRNIEITLLTFLPMCVSWVIILGIMAVSGIRFNIVNIILATFIFGIGDDFSIFVMDGLLSEHNNGEKLLNSHKTAIFFSAFTVIVGMGAMFFAGHPSLKSIAFISVLGISVVVLVAFTLEPFLFRLMISGPASKGLEPVRIKNLLFSLYAFTMFAIFCLAIHILLLIIIVLPCGKESKRKMLHKAIHKSIGLYFLITAKRRISIENLCHETFDKPAIIICNHQSFLDILILLSISPKLVIVTKSWVWNSPVFGLFIRYAGFIHSTDGFDSILEQSRETIRQGCSIIIFPEGTRSADGRTGRFHHGAFSLAQELDIDIVLAVIHGAGKILPKHRSWLINNGRAVCRICRRYRRGSQILETETREQPKLFKKLCEEQLESFKN